MDLNQGKHPNVSASSWENTPLCSLTWQVLADTTQGHMQCWAPEVQICKSSLYIQGTYSLPGAVRPVNKQQATVQMDKCTDGGVGKMLQGLSELVKLALFIEGNENNSG